MSSEYCCWKEQDEDLYETLLYHQEVLIECSENAVLGKANKALKADLKILKIENEPPPGEY